MNLCASPRAGATDSPGKSTTVRAVGALVLLLGAMLVSTAAGNAVGQPRIWVTGWHPDTCSGDTCSITHDGGPLPFLKINGEGFAVGETVDIAINLPGYSEPERYFQAKATKHSGFDGGSFGYGTEYSYCESDPRGHPYELQGFGKSSRMRTDIIEVELCNAVPKDTTIVGEGPWWWPW